LQDDLIANLLGTSYLPCYSGPTTYTIFRNQPVLDGAFGNGFRQMWWVLHALHIAQSAVVCVRQYRTALAEGVLHLCIMLRCWRCSSW
jgi:hypothetical protein